MATVQEAVRRLRIESTESGVQQTTDKLKALGKAHSDVAAASEKSERATQSSAKRLEGIQRQYDQAYRAQQQLAKIERDLAAAREQGLVSQQRASELMQLAIRHHNGASGAAAVHARVLQELQSRAMSSAASLGMVGSVLTVLGPAGLAAGAAMGVTALGIKQAADASLQLADRAGKLKDFAETTGFTVIQLQALEKAGAQVGVSSESVNKALERFSVTMDDVRAATGPVYDTLLQIDPALARQIARTTSAADAWDLFAVATQKANLEQRNVLARQTFGRGGIEITRLLGANADAGGLKGLIGDLRQVDLITKEQAERWDMLGDKINENLKAARQNIVATFAGPTLETLLAFSTAFLELSRTVKALDTSKAETFLTVLGHGLAAMIPGLTLAVAAVKLINSNFGPADTRGITTGPNQPTAEENRTAALERQRAETIRSYNEEKRRMEVLGEAATASEKLKLKTLELAAAVAKDGTVAEAAARNLADYTRAAEAQRIAGRMQLGIASFGEIDSNKAQEINIALRDGVIKTVNDLALAERMAAKDARELKEELMIRQSDMPGLTRWLLDAQNLDKQLDELAVSAANTFSSLARDIANGADPMVALVNQAQRLNDILIDMATKKLVAAAVGSLFESTTQTAGPAAGATAAAGILTTAGTAVAASIVAGATEAATILGLSVPSAAATLPVAGAATGTEVAAGGVAAGGALAAGGTAAGAAIWGPLALLMAAIAAAGLLLSSSDKGRQEEIRVQALRNRAILAGTDTDTLEGRLRQFDLQADLERKSLPGGGKTQQSWLNKLSFGFFGDKGGRQTDEAAALEAALAAERLKIIENFKKRAVEIEKQRMDAARQVRDDALKVLDTTELSDVAQRMLDIDTAAKDLTDALKILGESTSGVAEKTAAAIAKLRAEFTSDLERQINSAGGKGFLNDFTDLFAKIAQMRADAAKLGGVDVSKIDTLFALQAQQLVDSAQLTGEAFAELIKKFPQLAGLVRQFGDSVAQISARNQALDDRLFKVLNDSSTLEGALAAFDRDAERQRLEERKLGGGALLKLEQVLMAERLKIIQDFNAKALEEQKRAAEETAAFFASLRRNLREFIDNLKGGTSSPLSAIQRLAEAQAAYDQQLALAQGGDRDALSGITQYSSRLIEAARSVFGSSSGFQSLFNTVIAQLEALPDIAVSADPVIAAIEETTAAVDQTNIALTIQKGVLDIIKTSSQATETQVTATKVLQETANVLLTTSKNFLDQLVQLNTTMSSTLSSSNGQLATLNALYNLENGLLPSLTENMKRTVKNVRELNLTGLKSQTVPSVGAGGFVDPFASGGWVDGGIRGRDSVRAMLMPGEFVLREPVAQMHRAALPALNATGQWPANDNAGWRALIAEVKALRAEVKVLRQETRTVGERVDANTQHRGEQSDRTRQDLRMTARKNATR